LHSLLRKRGVAYCDSLSLEVPPRTAEGKRKRGVQAGSFGLRAPNLMFPGV
jgi:hypothetical protein